MCRTLELPTADRIRILGMLDVRLVLHVLKKAKDFEASPPATIDGIIKAHHYNTITALLPLYYYIQYYHYYYDCYTTSLLYTTIPLRLLNNYYTTNGVRVASKAYNTLRPATTYCSYIAHISSIYSVHRHMGRYIYMGTHCTSGLSDTALSEGGSRNQFRRPDFLGCSRGRYIAWSFGSHGNC